MNVEIDYTNYRGERSVRTIQPIRIFFGRDQWHITADQWLLEAYESEKKNIRYFAMNGIHSWRQVKDNEGHGFRNEENRFDFYEAMEKFLSKHIKS